MISPKQIKREIYILLKIGIISIGVGSLGALLIRTFDIPFFIFGYSSLMRIILILTMYVYLTIVISMATMRYTVTPLVLIPVITQYYQLILGYDVPVGASSILRLFPLVVMFFSLVIWIGHDRPILTRKEILIAFIWIMISLVSTLSSFELTTIGVGAFFLSGILIPSFYVFVKGRLRKESNSLNQFLTALTVGFIFFFLGSIFSVWVGLDYRGGTNLLVTRSISDTNFVLGYMLLLWPFAVIVGLRISKMIPPLFALVFLTTILFSFSRGALLIVIPILLITMILCKSSPKVFMGMLALPTITFAFIWYLFPQSVEEYILYPWSLRTIATSYGNLDLTIFTAILNNISEQLSYSGRFEIWNNAWGLFLENPWLGNGFGSFEKLGPGFAEAHSILFHVLVEQGVTGFIFLYGFFFFIIWNILKVLKEEEKNRGFYLIFFFGFLGWFAFNHTVAASFVLASEKGFQANAIAPLLLIFYIQFRTINPFFDYRDSK